MRSIGPEPTVLALAILLFAGTPSAEANLLRNGSFQDDWLTHLPENQNHHWCYSTGFQNRRDYNPDSWFLSGNWKWLNADGPPGSRRIVLEGPRSEALQRINWVLVHDDRSREGFPDAGGFPAPALQRSTNPLSLVRDLTLRVRVRRESVPKGGAGFMHEGGRVLWGQTTIEEGRGSQVLWGDALAPPPTVLEKTRIEVSGLKAGARIRVLFEDREIVAAAGYFVDDFRGQDLYQRFGGGPGVGYGGEPVALHVYEIP